MHLTATIEFDRGEPAAYKLGCGVHWLCGLLFALSSCSTQAPAQAQTQAQTSQERCGPSALARVARSVESASPSQVDDRVIQGLRIACGDALPTVFERSFEPGPADVGSSALAVADPEFRSLRLGICPDYARMARARADAAYEDRAVLVFEGCNFARFGVLAPNQAPPVGTSSFPWVMHAWTLKRGASPQDARIITRALLAEEQRTASLIQTLAGQRLPRASGTAVGDGIALYVSKRAIFFNEMKLNALRRGEFKANDLRDGLATELHSRLKAELAKRRAPQGATSGAPADRVLLVLDADVPTRTLHALMATAMSVGLDNFAFIAQTESLQHVGVEFGSPRIGGAIPEAPAVPSGTSMSINILENAALLETTSRPGIAKSVEPDDAAAIAEYTRAMLKRDPSAHQVWVAASEDVPTQWVVSAIAAVRGVNCDEQGRGCAIDEVTVRLSPALNFSKRIE